MSKILKKGLRLNEVNRKEIVELIIAERMGAELKELDGYRKNITEYVERSLIDRLSKEQGLELVDLSTIPAGVMPTLKRIYLGDGFARPEQLVDFDRPVRVPAIFYGQGALSWEFKFTADELAELNEFAALRFDIEGRAKTMKSTMMTFLNGFTSPQKLLDAAPDFEPFLPKDMFEEEAAPQVTLADVLEGRVKAA